MLLLEKINQFFGVGNVTLRSSSKSVEYSVTSIEDINTYIIPHFLKYPLLSKKGADFLLFKSIIDLMNEKEHLKLDGLTKIIAIRASLNLGLSSTLKENFSDIIQIGRPVLKELDIPNYNWLVGFSEGEGSFSIGLSKSELYKTGYKVSLSFSISQHNRDILLMEKFAKFTSCGNISVTKDINQYVTFKVTKLSDIVSKILPLFSKYSLQGSKKLDFEDFKKAVLIVNNKEHLTEEGINIIMKLKEGLNLKREWKKD